MFGMQTELANTRLANEEISSLVPTLCVLQVAEEAARQAARKSMVHRLAQEASHHVLVQVGRVYVFDLLVEQCL